MHSCSKPPACGNHMQGRLHPQADLHVHVCDDDFSLKLITCIREPAVQCLPSILAHLQIT